MRRPIVLAVWAMLAALALSALAGASEDEAWLRRATLPASIAPLLVVVVDTSGAMADEVDVLPPYDPGRDYTTEVGSACRRDRVYWRLGSGPPPDCSGTQWVSREATSTARGWRCEAGGIPLDSVGVFIAARAAQWEARVAGGYWRALQPGDDGAVECLADRGRHGATTGSWFAADGEGGPWRGAPDAEPDWQASPLSGAYVFFTGNYLAYLASAERIRSRRYDWLVRRLTDAARATAPLDIALVRFSHDGLGGDDDARGGMLAQAPLRLPEGATAIGLLLEGWNPGGPAPIAETLVEVARWLGGNTVFFGETSHLAPGVPFPSVAGTRSSSDPGTYKSPFEHACRPILTAVATSGQPGADAGAGDASRDVLHATATGCNSDCAARLAEALAQGDLLEGLPGRQRTAVRWLLAPGADPSVRTAALAGGSHPLDLDQPGSVLALFVEALQHDAAEASGPRVSAAGLESRPFTAADTATYFALAQPAPGPSWPGNLRRYRLVPSPAPPAPAVPAGRDGEPAFDDSGRLREGSWSEWSAAAEGPDPARGGAVALLPRWDERRVFSDLADAPLTDALNRVAPGNPLLTRERLGLPSADPRGADLLVEWLLGRDVLDADRDGDEGEGRHAVGDGGRRAPRILRYAPEGPALAFLATNDGVLHAFDADTGIERWAFMPAGLLSQAAERSSGGVRFSRLHGLDGPVALMLEDANQDGRIDARDDDEAWLFLSLGRGGTGYYGLDVSDPDAPRLLWTLRDGDLPGFAQSWPAPVPARMRLVPAVQGGDPRVLVLAGGHDPAEDAAVPPASSVGAGLAVVAAATGTVLWRAAGPAGPQADLELPALQRSLPAAPRVLDSDGDGLDDRAYALDAGGQLFRFEFPVNVVGDPAVAARRIADLGVPEGPDAPRRFRASPDVVLERRQGTDVLALSFGSGWASRPRSREAVDRFYVVFDALRGSAAAEVIDESDLADVTDGATVLPPAAAGWMYRLIAHGGGEKVTGSSLTFDHRVRFTTYQPLPAPPEAPCGPPAGVVRLYTLDIRDGRPIHHVGDRPVPDEELDVDGLAPALGIAFPPASQTACSHSGCPRAPTGLLGGRVVPLGFRNDPVRTSWRQLDAEAE